MRKLAVALLAASFVVLVLSSITACPPTGEGEGEPAAGEGEGAVAAGEGEGEGAAAEGEGEGAAEGEGEGAEGEGEGSGEGEGEGAPTVFDDIGGDTGVKALIEAFVANVLADNAINGYFSNDSLESDRLITCLAAQVSSVTGKPGATYPTTGVQSFPNIEHASPATVNCRDMATIHQQLHISSNDFDALIGDFAAAMVAKNVPAGDQTTIAAVLTGQDLKDQIITDVNSNATAYQRIGGKPALLLALNGTDCDPNTTGSQDCFIAKIENDTAIKGFFVDDANLFTGQVANPAGHARLVTCLERQISQAAGGPEIYDHANTVVDGPALTPSGGSLQQCRDMTSTHSGLRSAGTTGTAIDDAEFNDLESDLLAVLTTLGVSTTDQNAIANALNSKTTPAPGADAQGLCKDIVAGGTNCP